MGKCPAREGPTGREEVQSWRHGGRVCGRGRRDRQLGARRVEVAASRCLKLPSRKFRDGRGLAGAEGGAAPTTLVRQMPATQYHPPHTPQPSRSRSPASRGRHRVTVWLHLQPQCAHPSGAFPQASLPPTRHFLAPADTVFGSGNLDGNPQLVPAKHPQQLGLRSPHALLASPDLEPRPTALDRTVQ